MPNRKQDETLSDTDVKDEKNKKDIKKFKIDNVMKSVADDMMAELEAFAPSKSGEGESDTKKVEKEDHPQERSIEERSRDRKSRRNRSKDRLHKKDSKSRRSRSREIVRSRDRDRSKDRDRSRERDRSR